MSDHRAERMMELLEQLAASQTAAALCLAEMRSLTSVDHASLSVHWQGRRCELGCTITFRLFERLSRRANTYVAHSQLLCDVWDGNVRAPETIRSVVRHLKRRLREAGMSDLADAIRAQGGRYGLMLDASA
jgi:DNA-binding response OmpR family regulator